MAAEYRVRLPDGSEYGPADAETLRLWYQEGRIRQEALVVGAEDTDWRPLGEAFDLGAWARPEAGAAPLPRPTPRPPIPHRAAPAAHHSGLWIGGVVVVILVVIGAIVGLKALLPQKRARERDIAQWASSDSAYADPTLGVGLSVPKGWIILRKESPLLVFADAKVTFAQPSLAAFAVIRAESVTSGISNLDAYLDRVLENRRLTKPSVRDLGRTDLLLGKTPARQLLVSWDEAGQGVRGATVVWQDAWNYFQLSGWCPEAEAQAFSQEFEALKKGLEIQGVLSARLEEAAKKVMDAAPQLSKASAQMLVRDGLGRGLTPEEVAEKSYQVAAKGFVVLTRSELKEMSDTLALVYNPMTESDRAKLAAYLNRIKTGQPSSPDEDSEMREAMRNGLLALPDDARARLQAIFEKAIAAGLVTR
jgi:hypothetical protein